MANKIWNYGQVNGLDRKLKLVGFNFIEEDQPNAGIVVYLREQVFSPEGKKIIDKNADYGVIKGQVSTDIDGVPLPKRNLAGEIQYQLDEEGNVTDIPQYRDNGYENIKYYIDNKIFTVHEMIDAGVIERFKLSVDEA